jgi:hypothetical protein
MPEPTLGFVPQPNCGRGTIDIIWSCLLTIFLCTYTVSHLDIRKNTGKWNLFKRKAIWLVIGVLAPEYTALAAMREWKLARNIRQQLENAGWHKPSIVQGFVIGMNGIKVKYDCGTVVKINGAKLEEILRMQASAFEVDFPTVEEIEDKSKADVLGKAVTCFQILWFLTQSIARYPSHLQISPLELATVSYITMAIIAYIFWWKKPYAVAHPFVVHLGKRPEGFEKSDLEKDWKQLDVGWTELVTWFSILSVFVAFHFAAWNYSFPTKIERILWHASCFMAVGVGVSEGIVIINDQHFSDSWIGFIGAFSLPLLYSTARLYMITAMFMAFRSAPASIYTQVNWTDYWFHLGS